jgi:hypothetical protein
VWTVTFLKEKKRMLIFLIQSLRILIHILTAKIASVFYQTLQLGVSNAF